MAAVHPLERDLKVVPDHEPGNCMECDSESTPRNPVYKLADGARECLSCLTSAPGTPASKRAA